MAVGAHSHGGALLSAAAAPGHHGIGVEGEAGKEAGFLKKEKKGHGKNQGRKHGGKHAG